MIRRLVSIMAASIGMRPSLIKSLFLPRSYCLGCGRGNSTASKQERQQEYLESTRVPKGQIQIPKRKKRDPTAILKALSSTVKRDPTAPEYVYMDDPYLIPRSFLQKKSALLSKASGRRTARFVVNEFKVAFEHDAAAPHVPAFQPMKQEYTYTDPCNEALLERITLREFGDAIEVYKRMQEEGIEVTEEAKIHVLELLCAYGGQDPGLKLMPEERLIPDFLEQQTPDQFGLQLAWEIFESLAEKTDDTYNWMTRALLKCQLSKGFLLFEEMKSKDVPVSLGVYNEVIAYVGKTKGGKLWPSIKGYLHAIKKDGLAPNLETFHSVFQAIIDAKEPGDLKRKIPQILAEMRNIDIEPTLTTWSMVLTALGGRRAYETRVLSDLMEIISHIQEQNEQGPVYNDSITENFFITAIQICRKFQDSEAAIKLFNLKESLGSSYVVTSLNDDTNFYNDLISTVSAVETPEVTMSIYDRIFPLRCTPNPWSLYNTLKCIDTFGEYQYVLKLWEHADVTFRRRKLDIRLLMKFLTIFSDENLPEKLKLQGPFAKIAEQLLTDRMAKEEPVMDLDDGKLFLHLITIFLNNNDLQLAWDAMTKFHNQGFDGYIHHYVYARVFETCVDEHDVEKIKGFCELPEEVISVGHVYDTIADIIEYKKDILEEILTEPDFEKLRCVFPKD